MIHIKTAISGMFSSVCSVCSAYMHQTGLLGSLLFINLNPLSQFQTFRLMKHEMLITNDATQNWETVTERKWSSSGPEKVSWVSSGKEKLRSSKTNNVLNYKGIKSPISHRYYPLKICNIIFRKWGGGVEGCLKLFCKFIRFSGATRPFLRSVMLFVYVHCDWSCFWSTQKGLFSSL